MTRLIMIIAGFVFAIGFKITPHLPNFSPELVFAYYYMLSSRNRWLGLSLALSLWLAADFSYSLVSHYPVFGAWSIDTYGALILLFIAFWLLKINFKPTQPKSFIIISLGSSSFFWLYSNFGVWLSSHLYTLDLPGLITCYTLALPFLAYSLFSTLFWSVVICYYLARNQPNVSTQLLCTKQSS